MASSEAAVRVAGVELSNPDRVLYPAQGITKRELAEYFAAVGETMLPHVADRPLTLVRCPRGRQAKCFYQKHLEEGVAGELGRLEITSRRGETTPYVYVESVAGLVALAQLGVLEIHPWGARRHDVDRPDRLVFDLDPGAGPGWREVLAAARTLRRLLEALDLPSYPRLTGGKGIHLVVPIVPELRWPEAKAFARGLVELMAAREPSLYTTNPLKKERRGRIYLDYLRNEFGNTAIASFSPRARPGAPVATPVRWDEVGPSTRPDRYTVRNVLRRLASLRQDPWPDLDRVAVPLWPQRLEELAAPWPKRGGRGR